MLFEIEIVKIQVLEFMKNIQDTQKEQITLSPTQSWPFTTHL